GLRRRDWRDPSLARPELGGRRRRARAALRARLLRWVADSALPPRGAGPKEPAPARRGLFVRRRLLPLARAFARLAGRQDRRGARTLPASRPERELAPRRDKLPFEAGRFAAGVPRRVPGGTPTSRHVAQTRACRALSQGR